jgi:predicted nucleic acid-binding protein
LKAVTLDASATAAWLLPDEATPATDALYREAVDAEGVFQAPALWMWESGNLLRSAQRRGRLSASQVDRSVGLLRRAQVRLESAPDEARMRATLLLAASHALSFYDASYLEQALRTEARLATRDAALQRAASRAGVVCIDL